MSIKIENYLTDFYTIILITTLIHKHTLHSQLKMTSKCIAIRIASATEYEHSDWDTGTVAYQCEKNASKGKKFCGVCAKHKGAFGKIGCSYTWDDGTESTVPEYALKDGSMEDGTKVSKGDAMCYVFANPLMDEEGNMLEKKQELLDDEYWQCDKEEDEYDCDDEDDEDEDEDEGCWTDDEDCDDEQDVSPRKKALNIAELREMCDDNDIDHDGLSKADMREALELSDSDSPKAKTKKPSPKDKVKRKPTAYNLFMKSALKKYKAKNPDVTHKDAFCSVAAQWTEAKDAKDKKKSKSNSKKA